MAEVERLLDILPTATIDGSLGGYGEVIVCESDEEMVREADRHRLRARPGHDADPDYFLANMTNIMVPCSSAPNQCLLRR